MINPDQHIPQHSDFYWCRACRSVWDNCARACVGCDHYDKYADKAAADAASRPLTVKE